MLFEAISSVLNSAGLGTVGTNIYAELPDTSSAPVEVIAVRAYAGRPPLHHKSTQAPAALRPRFQVVTRAESYVQARQKAHDAFDALSGFLGTLEGDTWSIRALQGPFPLGKDEGGNQLFTFNMEALIGG